MMTSICSNHGYGVFLQKPSHGSCANRKTFYTCTNSFSFKASLKGEAHSKFDSHKVIKSVEGVESEMAHRRATLNSDIIFSRRSNLIAMFSSFFILDNVKKANAVTSDLLAEDSTEIFPLGLYIDEVEGFRVLKPLGWEKVEKSGANTLFEDPFQRKNNIGVVINPVRIEALAEFGSPTEVADRLIQVERKKPSTKDVKLLNLSLRKVKGGIPLYTIEYFLDTTRGAKKILTAVTISKRKLYILNISYADGSPQISPLILDLTMHKVLESFDLV